MSVSYTSPGFRTAETPPISLSVECGDLPSSCDVGSSSRPFELINGKVCNQVCYCGRTLVENPGEETAVSGTLVYLEVSHPRGSAEFTMTVKCVNGNSLPGNTFSTSNFKLYKLNDSGSILVDYRFAPVYPFYN